MKPYKYIRVSYPYIGDDSQGCIHSFHDKDTDEGNKLTLIHSHRDEGWTLACKGKPAASLECDGNGYTVKMGDTVVRLDYAQAEYITLLLKEQMKLEGRNHKVVSQE